MIRNDSPWINGFGTEVQKFFSDPRIAGTDLAKGQAFGGPSQLCDALHNFVHGKAKDWSTVENRVAENSAGI